ncbi:hypothetical protein [Vulcaniibacterium tengchongense]|uniref:Uncharacterized protein n=1 Tax=Vulcaniibacterium tengchongense TaxID=1273429 RepID=A0A3N4VL95_9GAMM|nr:hypothetical protein [Vulcaniibacterium tengchongense]RPE74650.1 hypothetical protein EDC50_3179 [Vulcaniibacterium tengchongense]
MSNDTQVAPAHLRRAIAAAFGEIANTLEWSHHGWLALMAKLDAAGKPAAELTLAEVVAAIRQVHDQLGAEVQP